MYENKTQENILIEMLESITEDINKEEGSIIYTTLAAQAEKLEEAYADIEAVYDNSFADTCDREHLIRKCAERGIKPEEATYAVYKGICNCEMSVGDMFSKDDFNFVIISSIGENTYRFQCETAGTEANKCLGEILFLGDNKNFETAELTDLLIPAKDEEETEELRARYFLDVESANVAGNIESYIIETNRIDGVGASKCIPVEEEGKTAKILFISSDYASPSGELVKKVQDTIDPSTDINNWGEEYGLPLQTTYKGKGYGKANIDHSILCQGVKSVPINIVTTIEFERGYSFDILKDDIEQAVENYLLGLRKSWSSVPNIVVRKSRLEAAILQIKGIEDITDTLVNGVEIATLDINEIPVRGDVTNE